MKLIIGRLVALALLSFPAMSAEPPGGRVLHHAFIPSAENVHGESRLLALDDAACVQTILHSPSFRKGVREIQLREADVWARQQPGFEDSLKYREELEQVKQLIVGEPRTENDAGKPYSLMIDFVFAPGRCTIEFFRVDVERAEDTFKVLQRATISSLPVSDPYMSRAMLIMTAAAFGRHRQDSVKLLEAAGWKDLSPRSDVQAPLPLR